MKAKTILIYAILAAGLSCYLYSIGLGLGYSGDFPIFFDPSDLFADYIKFIASYVHSHEIRVETWAPGRWRASIEFYLSQNPYGSDPATALTKLTHFPLPPLVQVLYAGFASKWLVYPGPLTSFIAVNAGLLLVLAACVIIAFGSNKNRMVAFVATIFLYPSLLAVIRGNVLAIISSLAVCIAFLSVVCRLKPVAWTWLLLAIAIGLRPNNILFLPLVCILQKRCISGTPPIGKLFAMAIAFTSVSLGLSFAIARLVYPVYTPKLFQSAYRYYQQNYELGLSGRNYGSSLLQPLATIGDYMTSKWPSFLAVGWQPWARLLALAVGLGICAYSYYYANGKSSSFSRAILINAIGMILATPVFADYHLMVLLAPIFIASYFEPDHQGLPSQELPSSVHHLSRLDALVIILLMVPKPFTLPVLLVTAQTFINPMIAIAYLYVLWFIRKDRVHMC